MIRIIKWCLLGTLLIVLLLTGVIYGTLSVSLPSLSGTTSSTSISAKASLERDDIGHAVVTAKNRTDAAFVLGYAHGQDRFFQMDLLRRNSAGELSELFGKGAITLDKKMRFHQFRKRSEKIYANLPIEHKDILEKYAAGVNSALAHSPYASFEYLLTQSERRE